MKQLFKKKGLSFAIYSVATLIIFNIILIFYLSSTLDKTQARERKIAFMEPRVEKLRKDIMEAALDSYQYWTTRDGESLNEYSEKVQLTSRDLDTLIYHLKRLETNPYVIARVDSGAGKIISAHQKFLSDIQGDSIQAANAFSVLNPQQLVADKILSDVLSNDGNVVSYATTVRVLKVLQVILLASIPLLVLVLMAYRKGKSRLETFNRDIEESNRKYVFNDKDEVNLEDDETIRSRLLTNLKKASEFIQQVADGNYAIQWDGITNENSELNKDNIAGELIRMREQMKLVKEQDEKRIWTTEGLSMFGELIRKNQDNYDALADNFISNAVKYLNAKVGGLFILEEDQTGKQFLELKACYAYERKKYISKRIEIGEGLIGQTYLEGLTIHLKEIPDEYMVITSGLGGSRPKSLVLVPLKTNERIEGVLELASFNDFKPHEIEFLEKIGEQLASSVISVRTAQKTRSLLEVSQQQSEEMKAQEEEMRQNMEELEATQEQMHRQVNEMNTLKHDLEKEKYLFNALMGNIPDAIYFKDADSKFIRVSAYLAKHFKSTEDELIGKSDFDFQDESHAREAFEDEKNIMKTRQPKIDYVEREVLADGSEHYVSTTKMPLENLHGEVVGTFGISRDVTKLKKLEYDVKKKEQELKEEEKLHRIKIKQLEDELDAAQKELEKLKKK
ncbi:MAG TPA: PAS domain-containing protein [Cyclobacteriaceae bacterium]|nr:PAS domain-containing protein [Cyclobacteriaceae bacterium]